MSVFQKRIVPLLLLAAVTLTALAGAVFAVPAAVSAKEAITIEEDRPAILADVGEKIDFSDYSIKVGSTVLDPGDLTWSSNGSIIQSFTPQEKGVYELTVTGETSEPIEKKIYLIVKNADETEYVLYENDFDCTLDDLKAEGWVFVDNANPSVSDGNLHVGSKDYEFGRAILPPYIGNFSTYSVEVVATQTNVANASRWCSIAYHIDNANGKYYPYYHMCVRNHTTNSTIEFAERNKNNAWNVISTLSKNMDMAQPHKIKVACFDDTVQYFFDDESVFYTANANAHTTGYAGLISNYGVMNVDSIKVVLLMEKPEKPYVPPMLIDTSGNRPESNITNYVSNHAFVTYSDYIGGELKIFDRESYPVATLLDPEGEQPQYEDLIELLGFFKEKNMIPEFRLQQKAEVDALNLAVKQANIPETVVVGSAEIVKYARTKNPTVIRGILDYTANDSMTSVYDVYAETAGAYAQGVLLPYKLATKETVAELQEYELAVWAFHENPQTDTEVAWLLTSGANAVVTGNWDRMAEAQTSLIQATNALTRTPVITAHRGDHRTLPENSLAAYASALEQGVDCIETDVYMTKDGELVILHDGTLDRTSNGTGNVSTMTLAEIQQYKLKNTNGTLSEETFPTFRQLLELCKGKDIRILCEIKGSETNLTKKTADLIKEFEMEDQVVYISFNASQLQRAKTYMNVSTGYLLSAPSESHDISDTVGNLNSYYEQQQKCLTYHSTMAINYGNINAEFLRDANDRGLTLWTWTYSQSNSSTTVCTNFLTGMNGMTTDYPPYLKNTVKTLLPEQDRISIKSKGTAKVKINAITYLQNKLDVTTDSKLNVQLLDNDGVISYSNGTITALKDGTASILFSYEAKLPNGKTYTLYTQPVQVFVNVKDPDQKYERGDVNGDGKLNANDYMLVKRTVLGTYKPDSETYKRMDVNLDNAVNAKDYLLLKRVVLQTYTFD